MLTAILPARAAVGGGGDRVGTLQPLICPTQTLVAVEQPIMPAAEAVLLFLVDHHFFLWGDAAKTTTMTRPKRRSWR